MKNMKKSIVPLIIVFMAFFNVIGQEYEIISVDPDFLVPGESNDITVVLNKNLEEGDSVLNAGVWLFYKDGFDIQAYSSTCERVDSIFNITMELPDGDFEEYGVFYLRLAEQYDSIVYESMFIGPQIAKIVPEICLVSIDSANRNVIIWENPQEETIDSVYIYKETSIADNFEKIGSQSIEELSEFVDLESINAQNSNRYAISFVDNAGSESVLSEPHKTLHLTSNLGLNWSVNLIWDKYEGFDYSTFYIYRSLNSKDDMVKIAEIAGNLFTFTDLNPPLGFLYYQVAVVKPEPCNSDIQKSEKSTYTSSVSNIVEQSISTGVDLKEIENSVNIFPNPAGDKIFISSQNELLVSSVTILDMMGRIMQIHEEWNNESGIDISDLVPGTYLVQIGTKDKTISKIIIKQ